MVGQEPNKTKIQNFHPHYYPRGFLLPGFFTTFCSQTYFSTALILEEVKAQNEELEQRTRTACYKFELKLEFVRCRIKIMKMNLKWSVFFVKSSPEAIVHLVPKASFTCKINQGIISAAL